MLPPPVRCLLLFTLLLLAACERQTSTEPSPAAARAPGSAATRAPPPAPKELPASWPTGDAITLALTPAAGATSLTKALYERGDIVLEQTWPDGTRERWWHATDGSTRYVGRDGTEHSEAAP
jgi:hypothetical protein